jgi:DNA-binding Lrp family transcriptional regulator
MKREQHADEAKLKNFTPLLDDLVQEYGLITAAVWGRVWRYAQQENHVCQAAHEKIAAELSISVRTVIRHIQVLVKAGYLKDSTPGLKNAPHTYIVTQKARISITVEGVTESHTKDPAGVSESQSGMTESHTGYDRESHEDTSKETIKDKKIPEQKIMFGTLSKICRIDPKLKAGQIGKTVKALMQAGYTSGDLETFIFWWRKNDFRGQKDEPPTISQVVDKILQSKQEAQAAQVILPTSTEDIILPDCYTRMGQ